jgi:hypothetical protein
VQGALSTAFAVLVLALVAMLPATPASANFFSETIYGEHHIRLIGTSRNPTPADLRCPAIEKGEGDKVRPPPKGQHCEWSSITNQWLFVRDVLATEDGAATEPNDRR